MKRIISIFTLITFLLSDVSFAAEAIHLSPPSSFDDITLGTSHDRNIAVVTQMALRMDLAEMAQLEPDMANTTSEEVLQLAHRKLKEKKSAQTDSVKPDIEGASDITVFFNEAKYVGGHIFSVPAKVVEGRRRYNRILLFSTIPTEGNFRSAFCSKEALEAVRERVAVQDRLPVIRPGTATPVSAPAKRRIKVSAVSPREAIDNLTRNLEAIRELYQEGREDASRHAVVDDYLGRLESYCKDRREPIIQELSKIVTPEAINFLINAFGDENFNETELREAERDALVRIGAPAIPHLSIALRNKNWLIRKYSAETLERLGWQPATKKEEISYLIAASKWDELVRIGKPAVENLLGILEDSMECRNAARILGEIGDKRAIEPLVKLLEGEEVFKDNRKEAAGALVKIGDSTIPYLVASLMTNKYWLVREITFETLGKLNWRPANHDEEIYDLIMKKNWDEIVRIGEATVVPLVDVLRYGFIDFRKGAAEVLDKLNWQPTTVDEKIAYFIARENRVELFTIGKPAVGHLIAVLKDENTDYAAFAASILIQIGEPAVDPLIEVLKKHDSAAYRRLAVVALGFIGEKAVHALIKALKDPEQLVRSGAAEALGAIKDRRAVEPLIEILDSDSDPWVRRQALFALAEIGDPRAIEPFKRALNDSESNVSGNVPYVLAQLGKPALDALIDLLEDTNQVAAYAVGQMAHKHPEIDFSAAARLLRIRFLTGENRYIRSAGVRALGDIGPVAEPAIPELAKISLTDPETSVRTEAAKSLLKILAPDLARYFADKDFGVFEKVAQGIISPEVLGRFLRRKNGIEQFKMYLKTAEQVALNIEGFAFQDVAAFLQFIIPAAFIPHASIEQIISYMPVVGRVAVRIRGEELSLAEAGPDIIRKVFSKHPATVADFEELAEQLISEWDVVGDTVISVALKEEVELLTGQLRQSNMGEREAAANRLGEIAATLGRDSFVIEKIIPVLIEAFREEEPDGDLADRSWHARTAAAKAMGKTGTQGTSFLVKALEDDNLYVRAHAAEVFMYILENNPHANLAEIPKHLMPLLLDKNQFVRIRAAMSLGEIGAPEAAEPLIEALGIEKQGNVRIAIVGALGKLGGPKAAKALLGLVNDEDTRVAGYAQLLHGGMVKSVIGDAQVSVVPQSAGAGLFIEVQQAAHSQGEPEKIAILVKGLEEGDSATRYTAASGLNIIAENHPDIDFTATVQPLIQVLRDKDPLVRQTAACALGRFGDARAIEPLVGILKDNDKAVRQAAAKALGRMKAKQAVDDLTELLLKDPSPYIREVAAEALGEIGDKKSVNPLIAALQEKDADVRKAAARALGGIGDIRAAEPLSGLLDDDIPSIVRAAADALTKIGDKRGAKTLTEIVPAIAIPYIKDTFITTPENFNQTSAQKIADTIRELQQDPEKEVTIVFATGNTMVGFLRNLALEEDIDWKRVQAFHLDEYKGLPPDHPSSFAYFLRENLFSRVPIPEENIHYIDGTRPESSLKDYMGELKKHGGADIVILGVGMDGHLAFCEPPTYSRFNSRIQKVELEESTLKANEIDYPGIRKNPYAYTMGMRDIFEGKHIFFLANKSKKAEIVLRSLKGLITEDVPASMLQLSDNVTAILDEDAASLLQYRIPGRRKLNLKHLRRRLEIFYVQSFSGVRYENMGMVENIAYEDQAMAFAYAYNYMKLVMSKNPQEPSYKIVMGSDPRPTGEAIIKNMARGVIKAASDAGKKVEIIDLGIVTTPLFESSVRTFDADGGVMISASHNPLEQNGWKFATANREPAGALLEGGSLLTAQEMGKVKEDVKIFVEKACHGEIDIIEMMREIDDDVQAKTPDLPSHTRNLLFRKALDGYVKEIKELVGDISSDILLINDANGGAAARVNTEVLKKLGLKNVVYLNNNIGEPTHKIEPVKASDEKDRYDPNKNALIDVVKALEEHNSKVGIVYDYDADRGNLVLLKPDGTVDEISPQDVSALNVVIELILNQDFDKKRYPKGLAVVGHCGTSLRTKEIAGMFGAEFFTAEVGEVNVVGKMAELERDGYLVPIGVEGYNGGTIFRGSKCRDGLQTLLKAAKVLSEPKIFTAWLRQSGQKRIKSGEFYLSEMVDLLPRYKSIDDKLKGILPQPEDFKTAMEKELKNRIKREKGGYRIEDLGDKLYAEVYIEYSSETNLYSKSIDKPAGEGLKGNFIEGGWKVRFVDDNGEESQIWLRGSQTERGTYRRLADAKSEEGAYALLKLLKILCKEANSLQPKTAEKNKTKAKQERITITYMDEVKESDQVRSLADMDLEELIEQLTHGGKRRRKEAVEALCLSKDPRRDDLLIQILKSDDEGSWGYVAEILGQSGNKKAIGPLAEALGMMVEYDQNNYGIMIAMRKALENLTCEEAVDDLARLSMTDYGPISHDFTSLLTKSGGQKALNFLIKFLKSRKLFLRLSAAKALSKFIDYKAIEALADAVKDRKEDVRRAAAKSLGETGKALGTDNIVRKVVIPVLIRALKDKEWSVRVAAAGALSKIDGKNVVGPIVEILKEDNWRTMGNAGETLRQRGYPEAATVLVGALKDEKTLFDKIALITDIMSGIFREAYADGLVTLKELELKLNDSNDYVRLGAVDAIGNIGDGAATASLLALLGDDSHLMRRDIVKALGKVAGPEVIDRLIGALKDNTIDIQYIIFETLTKIDSDIISTLIEWFDRSGLDTDLRPCIVRVLGKSRDSRVIPFLSRALGDPDVNVRYDAALSLGDIGSQEAIPILLKAMNDPSSYVRRKAAFSLGDIGDSIAVPVLIDSVCNDAFEVREAAINALDEIHYLSSKTVKALIDILKDGAKPRSVRQAIAKVLGLLGAISLVDLIRVVKEADDDTREIAGGAFEVIKDARATKLLISALEDENPYLRSYAARALGNIKRPEAIEALLKSMQENKYPGISAAAAGALVKIGGPVIRPLNKILADKSRNIRDLAAGALGLIAMQNESADYSQSAKALTEYLLIDEDEHMRLRAIRVLRTISLSAESVVPELIKIYLEDPRENIQKEILKTLLKICAPDIYKYFTRRSEWFFENIIINMITPEVLQSFIPTVDGRSDFSKFKTKKFRIFLQASHNTMLKLSEKEGVDLNALAAFMRFAAPACIVNSNNDIRLCRNYLRLISDVIAEIRKNNYPIRKVLPLVIQEAFKEPISAADNFKSTLLKAVKTVTENKAAITLDVEPELLKEVMFLIEQLNEKDMKKRESNIRALGEIAIGLEDEIFVRETIAPALIEIFREEAGTSEVIAQSWDCRIAVVNVLSKIGAPAVVALIAALEDDNEFVRGHSAQTLSYISSEYSSLDLTAAIPALIKRAKDSSRFVRMASIAALERIGDLTATNVLREISEEGDELLAERASVALDKISARRLRKGPGDESFISVWTMPRSDTAVELRNTEYLIKRGGSARVQGLVEGLKSNSASIRSVNAEALSRTMDDFPYEDFSQMIPDLRRVFLGEAESNVRRAIVETLGKMKAVEPLIEALEDKSPVVRQAVISALMKMCYMGEDTRLIEESIGFSIHAPKRLVKAAIENHEILRRFFRDAERLALILYQKGHDKSVVAEAVNSVIKALEIKLDERNPEEFLYSLEAVNGQFLEYDMPYGSYLMRAIPALAKSVIDIEQFRLFLPAVTGLAQRVASLDSSLQEAVIKVSIQEAVKRVPATKIAFESYLQEAEKTAVRTYSVDIATGIAKQNVKGLLDIKKEDFEKAGFGWLIDGYFAGSAEELCKMAYESVNKKIIRNTSQLPNNKTILFYTPHPDDDLMPCGGLMSLLSDPSLNNHIILLNALSGKMDGSREEDIKIAHQKLENIQPDMIVLPLASAAVWSRAVKELSAKKPVTQWFYRTEGGEYTLTDADKIITFGLDTMLENVKAMQLRFPRIDPPLSDAGIDIEYYEAALANKGRAGNSLQVLGLFPDVNPVSGYNITASREEGREDDIFRDPDSQFRIALHNTRVKKRYALGEPISETGPPNPGYNRTPAKEKSGIISGYVRDRVRIHLDFAVEELKDWYNENRGASKKDKIRAVRERFYKYLLHLGGLETVAPLCRAVDLDVSVQGEIENFLKQDVFGELYVVVEADARPKNTPSPVPAKNIPATIGTGLDNTVVDIVEDALALLREAEYEEAEDKGTNFDEVAKAFRQAKVEVEVKAKAGGRKLEEEALAELSVLEKFPASKSDDKESLIFSERVTFEYGLGILVRRLAKAGINVAVIARTEKERQLIELLNEGIRDPENNIVVAESIEAIKGIMAVRGVARYRYFKVKGDPTVENIMTFDITHIVERIIEALGRSCAVDAELLHKLHEATEKFRLAA